MRCVQFVFPELVIAIICGRRNFVYESADDDDGVYQLLRRSSGKNKEEDDGRVMIASRQ